MLTLSQTIWSLVSWAEPSVFYQEPQDLGNFRSFYYWLRELSFFETEWYCPKASLTESDTNSLWLARWKLQSIKAPMKSGSASFRFSNSLFSLHNKKSKGIILIRSGLMRFCKLTVTWLSGVYFTFKWKVTFANAFDSPSKGIFTRSSPTSDQLCILTWLLEISLSKRRFCSKIFIFRVLLKYYYV
jgi:hypothetical protein